MPLAAEQGGNQMGCNRNWTKEEVQYLTDNYGEKSYQTLSRKLNRSIKAIEIKARRLKLGSFLECGDYITWNQFQGAIGNSTGCGYKTKSWIQDRNFPIHSKKVRNNSFRIVYIHEFWKWAKDNQDLLDFSKMEENILGVEPDWAKEKRKRDFEKRQKIKQTPWTKDEDERLKYLLKKQKYTYMELSRMMMRTTGAIQRRCCDLNILDRPVKAENSRKWTESEEEILIELVTKGYEYELISEKIQKSSKAIRGKIGRMYNTENLDKVRRLIEESNKLLQAAG